MLANQLSKRLPFYYGWVIALVSAVLLFAAFGIRLSFSVFFVYLIDEFGWSRADTSIVFSTTMVVFALTSTAAGIFLDRYGGRRTFTLGCLILGFGLILSSRINSLWGLTLAYGVVAGLGITILGLSMHGTVIGHWFKEGRGGAIGIAFAGTGLGSFFVIPAVERIAVEYNWRSGMLLLAALILVMIPLVQLLVANRPEDIRIDIEKTGGMTKNSPLNLQPADRWTISAVLRAPSFWFVLIAGLFSIGPVRLLTVHQLAIFRDAGIETGLGAQIIGLAGLVTAATFIMSGILSDRIGRVPTYALGGACLIGALFLMINVGSLSGSRLMWLYPVLLGLGEGSRSSLMSAVVADLFSGRTLGAINGTVGGMFGVGAAILPWLGGYLFDQTGSYASPLIIGIASVCMAVTFLFLAVRFHK